MKKEDIAKVRKIFETQFSNGEKVIKLNTPMFRELLEHAELLQIDKELLKSKWEAQGLMIQKLHKEIKQLKKDKEMFAKIISADSK